MRWPRKSNGSDRAARPHVTQNVRPVDSNRRLKSFGRGRLNGCKTPETMRRNCSSGIRRIRARSPEPMESSTVPGGYGGQKYSRFDRLDRHVMKFSHLQNRKIRRQRTKSTTQAFSECDGTCSHFQPLRAPRWGIGVKISTTNRL